MNRSQWSEFLDKLDFVLLTGRWSMLPLHWLDEEQPEPLSETEQRLYEQLSSLKDRPESEREDDLAEVARGYRRELAQRPTTLDASLCPPGSRVTLRHMDPSDLGQGDCLITVGSWDRVGHLIAEAAGGEAEDSPSSETAVRREPGDLSYRHLLIFPEKGTPSPRAFRSLCEKTLRQARGLGARRIVVTHLHLAQPGLPDRFAAAELVSAIRQMLRDGSGMTVEIMPFTHRNYEDYRHWFESLKSLGESQRSSQQAAPDAESGSSGVGEANATRPLAPSGLSEFAQKASTLAQEATTQVSSWWKSQTEAAPVATGLPTRFAPTFEELKAYNQLYLGLWQEVRLEWDLTTLSGLYGSALTRVVRFLSAPEEDEEVREREFQQLRAEVQRSAELLGLRHPLSRYYRLLAWRLEENEGEETDLVRLEQLQSEAEAWDDLALLRFLRGQDPDSEDESSRQSGLVPVYSTTSRSTPEGGEEEERKIV